MLGKRYPKILWKVIQNRGGYTDEEIAEIRKTTWSEHFSDPRLSNYWIKVEMVKTNRCTAGWVQGDCLYFDFSGMLLTRKAPRLICPHAVATLSPVVYSYLDRVTRGAHPGKMLIDHVSCTDPGFDYQGLGNNTMRISVERMPRHEFVRNLAAQAPHLLHRSTRARGPAPGGLPAGNENRPVALCQGQPGAGQPDALKDYPLEEEERRIFAQSEKRMRRVAAMEKYRDARIAIRIVKSEACLAGHAVGDRVYFDSMGRLLPGQEKPVCSRLIHRAWYRLIMLMDRMADDSKDFIGDGNFQGQVPDVKIGCYSAEFPYGDCGRILMTAAVENNVIYGASEWHEPG